MTDTIALVVLLVVVGAVFALFTIDERIKKLVYVVLAVVVLIWALRVIVPLIRGLG